MKPCYSQDYETPDNCLQLCIASIFHLNPAEMPNFVGGDYKWWNKLCDFLTRFNIRPACSVNSYDFIKDKFYIAVIEHPESEHACVFFNESLVLDPNVKPGCDDEGYIDYDKILYIIVLDY